MLELDAEADEILNRLAETGRYGDRRDVVRAALMLLEARQEDARWQAFKRERQIERSLKDVAEGRFEDAEAVFTRLMRSVKAKIATDAAE
ncbi:hypothetical protein ABEG18_11660 [Alsobacter sp. KACC 23698]|uniref:Type II toxin-antitoxin system ParD family antitoxin n=1 Tax=Alsobacter sp. KACC 23698 TaxID=3149229 RepID=A0AAU7JLW6_9HYPH